MRQIAIYLVIVGIALNNVLAQQLPSPKIHRFGVGAFIGINRVTPLLTYYGQPISLLARYNLLVGGDLHFRLNQRSSFHLQPTWTRVNYGKSAVSYLDDDPSFTVSIAKLPLVYRYSIPTSTKVTPFLEVGVGYNLSLNSTYQARAYWICDPGPCSVDWNSSNNYSSTNKSAMSTIASLGLDINLKTVSIPIALRYEHYVNEYTFSSNLFKTNTQLRLDNIAFMTGINF